MKKKIFKYLAIGLVSLNIMSVAEPAKAVMVDNVLLNYIARSFSTSSGVITRDEINHNYRSITFINGYSSTANEPVWVERTATEILLLNCISKYKHSYEYRTY